MQNQRERPRWAGAIDDGSFDGSVPELVVADDANPFALSGTLWMRELLRNGYRFTRIASWPTSTDDEALEQLDGLAYLGRTREGSNALLDHADGAVAVSLGDGRLSVQVACRSSVGIDSILAQLRRAFPPEEVTVEEPRVAVTFWSLGQHGPVARTRMIDVPTWKEIASHYVQRTRGQLDALMDGFRPGVGGQLVLWHGPPGTGKTYALRSLAWAWREWCDLHYITDPEVFFGEKAAYMLEVLLHGGDDSPALASGPDSESDEPPPEPDPRAEGGRWKLLVLEDTGELASADARERSGQGLSRLLNVVDGLIGQGLRVLALVTTNEQLRTLHPAIARPGRCAANLEFSGIPRDEALEWLVAHGLDLGEANHALEEQAPTIADLFALLENRETTSDRERQPASFA